VRKVTPREPDVMAVTSFGGSCPYNLSESCAEMAMNAVEGLRSKAEAYLEKARLISNRHRARLLLVQAHNFLKCAEETEAEQLSAR
jgi:hypothetical protein